MKIKYGRLPNEYFKSDLYAFRQQMAIKDFTIAGMILKDVRNRLESWQRVLEKMETQYNQRLSVPPEKPKE